MLKVIGGFLLGLIVVGVLAYTFAGSLMFREIESPFGVEETVARIQQNIQNTRFGSYTVSNFFSNSASDSQLQFATQQPGIVVRNGGVASAVIDIESTLLNKSENERALEKLQLFQRPFLTVPYPIEADCHYQNWRNPRLRSFVAYI